MADEINNDDEELELRITILETKLAEKVSTKQAVAQAIAELFEHADGVATVITKSDRTGPMGGKSEQVNVIFTDEDGNVEGVIINVYKDSNTEQHVHQLLAEVARKKQLAEDVAQLPKRLDASEMPEANGKAFTELNENLMPDTATRARYRS